MDDIETMLSATYLYPSGCLEEIRRWSRPRQVCAGEFCSVSKGVVVVAAVLAVFQQYSKYSDQYIIFRTICFATLKAFPIMFS